MFRTAEGIAGGARRHRGNQRPTKGAGGRGGGGPAFGGGSRLQRTRFVPWTSPFGPRTCPHTCPRARPDSDAPGDVREEFPATELISYGGRLPDRRRLLVGGSAALSISLFGNFLGVTSVLLGTVPSAARSARLDVLFPVKGFKRCVDYQNGYEFIYPSSWLADQRLYRRYAQRMERRSSLDLPPLGRSPRASPSSRRPGTAGVGQYDPSSGYGPPKGNGEENISVVAAPIMAGFTLEGLGEPSTAAQSFLDSTIAPPGGEKRAVLLDAGSRTTSGGDLVYWFEFTVSSESKGWKRHNLAVIGSRDDALYTFNAQCNDSNWAGGLRLREPYQTAAASFNLISTTKKDFPESLT